MRHPGRWVVIAVIAVLVAMFVHLLVTNQHFEWRFIFVSIKPGQRGAMFIPPVLEGLRGTVLLTVTSMLIGLSISTLVTKGDQTMPILVGVTMVQVALSGGLFPVAGALSYVAAIAPARWGLGALASTINLNDLQSSITAVVPGGPPPTQHPDMLWTHDAVHWLTAVGVMIGLGLAWLIIARLRLATIGPRKRK